MIIYFFVFTLPGRTKRKKVSFLKNNTKMNIQKHTKTYTATRQIVGFFSYIGPRHSITRCIFYFTGMTYNDVDDNADCIVSMMMLLRLATMQLLLVFLFFFFKSIENIYFALTFIYIFLNNKNRLEKIPLKSAFYKGK